MKETLHQNGYLERFLFPQCSPSRKEKEDPRSCVTILYIYGVLEAVTVIHLCSSPHEALHEGGFSPI